MKDRTLIRITLEVDSEIDGGPESTYDTLGFGVMSMEMDRFLKKADGRVALVNWMRELAGRLERSVYPFRSLPVADPNAVGVRPLVHLRTVFVAVFTYMTASSTQPSGRLARRGFLPPTRRSRLEHNPLIYALDHDNMLDVTTMTTHLSGIAGTFKIGLELFLLRGFSLLKSTARYGDTFLDLKMCDIPTTVARALRQVGGTNAEQYRLKFVTVHAFGGREMMEAAVKAAAPVGVLAVTVLTSMSERSLVEIGVETPCPHEEYPDTTTKQVVRLARIAHEAGCAGVICASTDLGALRSSVPAEFLRVTPGIRPADANVNDQVRVMTPAEAVQEGADYIVVGRPIRDAADPVATAKAILKEAVEAKRSR